MDALPCRTYAHVVAHGTKTAMAAALRLLSISTALLAAGASAWAADLTVQQISIALAKASVSQPVDFSHRDLSYLDLSELDFKHANLSGANLYGTDLSHANLAGARLAGADLDHTLIIATNFAGADLSGVSLRDAEAFSTLEVSPAEAPNFAGANLAGAHIIARLSRSNMSGANLAHMHMGTPRDHTILPLRSALSGCNLANASLIGAELAGLDLSFADLSGADLSHANLARADLAHADLSGADLTGTDLTDADLDETVLKRAKGLAAAKGIDTARHHATTIR
jgi:uncharacterized protein YjbI with pentapeptide repeats